MLPSTPRVCLSAGGIDYSVRSSFRHIRLMIYDPGRRALELRQRIIESMTAEELEEYAKDSPAKDSEWKNGEVHGAPMADGIEYPIARLCSTCQHDHGYLYGCQRLPPEILDEIKQQSAEFMKAMRKTEHPFTHSGDLMIYSGDPP
jgi:hypothetical protein